MIMHNGKERYLRGILSVSDNVLLEGTTVLDELRLGETKQKNKDQHIAWKNQ